MYAAILIPFLWWTQANYDYHKFVYEPHPFPNGVILSTAEMNLFSSADFNDVEPNNVYDIEFDYLIPYGYEPKTDFKFVINHYYDTEQRYEFLTPKGFLFAQDGRWVHFSKGWRASKKTTSIRFVFQVVLPHNGCLADLYVKNFTVRKRGKSFDRP